MKTKMVMSITVDPKLKAEFYKAVKSDGDKASPIVEALMANYLEVRRVDRMEKESDPLQLRE